MDEATGVRKYIPITITDVNLFKREIEILCKELQHVIDDAKWFAVKHNRLTHYFCIYQTLTEYLTDFLETVHSLHKKFISRFINVMTTRSCRFSRSH